MSLISAPSRARARTSIGAVSGTVEKVSICTRVGRSINNYLFMTAIVIVKLGKFKKIITNLCKAAQENLINISSLRSYLYKEKSMGQ